MSQLDQSKPDDLQTFLAGLSPRELSYARAYAEHLSVAEPRPKRDVWIDPRTSEEIERRLLEDWNRRVRQGFRAENFAGLRKGRPRR